MSYLYVVEQGSVLGIEANCVKVVLKDQRCSKVPIENLESVSIFGHSQMTTQCMVECLKRDIPVAFYARNGTYFGHLETTRHIRAERQRKQDALYDSDFSLEIAKKIIAAKIHNQEVLLRRYARNKECDLEEEFKQITISASKIERCDSVERIMGYEGIAARFYFHGLSKLVEPEFAFHGRSKRPPKDEFNALLSFGYSIVMNEIYGKIVNNGLNPYFGFIHKDHEQHPTLASDLMEEWRAVIVDALVMSLVNGHEINKEHFVNASGENGYYLGNAGMKIFISRMEKKLNTQSRYLSYVDYVVDFRRAMELQIGEMVKAIDARNASLYKPLWIR